jgi:uncharacterized protein (DUF362 family)
LATQKTHGHSVVTGAIKNAFGGLLKEVRHHFHKYMHDVLVDLLIIEKEIHKGLFAVIDGTVCGDYAGPRTMVPRIKNYIIAGADQVAVDAVSAKLMGFNPFEIEYIRKAHDLGLGCADMDNIEIIGENISAINYGFKSTESLIIFLDKLLRNSPFERLLFHTQFFKLFILGSLIYHDYYWYYVVGRKYLNAFKKTEWGALFEKY